MLPAVLSSLMLFDLFLLSQVVSIGVGPILLIVLIVLLLGAVPAWPYSRDWGYYPSGGLGLVLMILLVLLLFRVI